MSDNMIEMVTAKQEADELHRQIMAAGHMATIAIVEMARCLKRMRDGGLYKERGFASFDEYVENDVGIGTRHAYNYIHVYEQLGESGLQSNAHLGITKLELLSRLPIADRQGLLEDPTTESESVAALKERIAELKKRGEQMSFLEEENKNLKAQMETVASEAASGALEQVERLEREREELLSDLNAAEQRRKEAEERADKIKASLKKAKENPKIPESMLEKIKQDEKKEAEQAVADDLKKAVEAAQAAEKERHALELETAAVERRLEEAERKLKAAAPEVAMFKALFENVQMVCGKMKSIIEELRTEDPATADKLRSALCAFAESLR